jgi:chromosome segregation ATPase
MVRIKSHLDLVGQRQLELMENKLKALGEFDARLSEMKKEVEEVMDSKFGKIKSGLGLSNQRQVQLLENKLKAIAEVEKRLSLMRKEAEDSMDSRMERAKSHLELTGQKQAELIESKLKTLAEFEKKLSGQQASIREISSSLGTVGRKLNSMGLDDDKLEKRLLQLKAAAQEELASKVSGLNDLLENKLSQVYSHVASEKKALAETRASLEREIRAEQKALLSKLAALSEKSEKKAAELSGEISSEKKGLSEERTRFSGSMRSAAQAIARLDEFSKSLDSRLGKSQDDISGRIKLIETRLNGSIEKSKTASAEKTDTLYSSLNARLAKLESGVYSERDDFSKRLKSMERDSKALSMALSSMGRQLNALASKKASAEKKATDSGLMARKLAGSLASIDSSSRSAMESLRKQVGLLETRNADLTEQLKKTQELMRAALETTAASKQKSATVASGQEEIRSRLKGLESAVAALSQAASQHESQLALRIAQMADAEKSKKSVAESELKAYVASLVKTGQESERSVIARMAAEISQLRGQISQWNAEQARLLDLLKEEE